eukprot:TRINITY_DN53604_c0_g1_i1.p1 TRINITY_DN53604_c0_g1~~TRINITY_DN53604_c0_g1_i1.p1  ORF type:complete len:222 (-),score=44.63 TRINITY_DN53604_c0_g1_i1:7-672(-)
MVASKFLKFAFLTAGTLSGTNLASDELNVDVYRGPSDCSDLEKIVNGSAVKMYHTGTIHKSSRTGEIGKQFDTSRDEEEPWEVEIGKGDLIAGLEQGIIGLCKGAKASLVIPPHLGWGVNGAGIVPGGATLHFDVEIVDVSSSAPTQDNLFKLIDIDEDGKLTKKELKTFFKSKGMDGIPDGLWTKEDKNKDGFIEWSEFSGPKGNEIWNNEIGKTLRNEL